MKRPVFVPILSILFYLSLLHSQEPGDILHIEFLDFQPVSEVQNLLDSALGPFAPEALYDISIYRIEYMTIDPFGETTVASGSIAFPHQTNLAFPLLSYQHGTVVLQDDVSSEYGFDPANMWMATTGHVVASPDYLGLGISEMLHPYHLYEPTALSIFHMLLAARSFCYQSDDIMINDQLILAGYSEGGYATMAAHKYIEEHAGGEFSVTLSVPMAGAHDLSGIMVDLMLSGIPYDQPYYVAYIMLAYIEYYQLGELDEFFTDYYAELLPDLFDGSHASWQINANLPSDPVSILRPEVLADFEENENHPIRLALAENNLYDWLPQAPVFLLHGMGDEIVPYENSQLAYNTFIANGAEDVTLELFPAILGGHAEVSLYCLFSAFDLVVQHSGPHGKGDVNADGSVDVLDIVRVVNHIIGFTEFTPYEEWAADYNFDGWLDVLDIVQMINGILES